MARKGEVAPPGAAVPPPNVDHRGEGSVGEEALGAESELDRARASYARACAWAWPYVNLRPLCRTQGFEAATILNPLIPVPRIKLSEASPDYKEIVAALKYWESKVPQAQVTLKDLHNDLEAQAAAARALADAPRKGMPQPQASPTDGRLAAMFDIFEQIKPALRRWRTDQHKIENLAEPLYIARATLAMLQAQVQNIRARIAVLSLVTEEEDRARAQAESRALQAQLNALMPQIARARSELAAIEHRIGELRADQASLAGQTNPMVEPWIRLCDVPGDLGPEVHQEAILLLDTWLVDEPRMWHLYLARGIARSHTGQNDEAIDDLKRVAEKLALYDPRPPVLAFVAAVQGYALGKGDHAREAERLFAQAKKLDKKSWWPYYLRGRWYHDRGKLPAAEREFKMVQNLGGPFDGLDIPCVEADDAPGGAAAEDTGPPAALRVWTDDTGRYTRTGDFVALRDDTVELKTTAGAVFVPFKRLSETDQSYVKSRVK